MEELYLITDEFQIIKCNMNSFILGGQTYYAHPSPDAYPTFITHTLGNKVFRYESEASTKRTELVNAQIAKYESEIERLKNMI